MFTSPGPRRPRPARPTATAAPTYDLERLAKGEGEPPAYPHPATPAARHAWRVAWGHYNGAKVAQAYHERMAAA